MWKFLDNDRTESFIVLKLQHSKINILGIKRTKDENFFFEGQA